MFHLGLTKLVETGMVSFFFEKVECTIPKTVFGRFPWFLDRLVFDETGFSRLTGFVTHALVPDLDSSNKMLNVIHL
jgi:hypothetical protein